METSNFSLFSSLVSDSVQSSPVVPEIKEQTPPADVAAEEKKDTAPKITDSTAGIKIQEVESLGEDEEEEIEEGAVIKPKVDNKKSTEKDKEEESEDDKSVFRTLAEVLDEKGIIDFNANDFEDTEEGLLGLVEQKVVKGIQEYKSNLGEQALELVEYLEAGGKLEDYVSMTVQPDFRSLTEDQIEDSLPIQKQLVRDLLLRQGYTKEEAESEIADFEDSGILFNKAKRAKIKLDEFDAKYRQQELQKQKEAEVAQKEAHSKWLKDLEDNINKRDEIAGFEIPAKKKKEFYEYITKFNPKTNKTGFLADVENDSEAQLKMAWLFYNKFDFSKVVKQAKKEVTTELKSKLQRSLGEGKTLSSVKGKKESIENDFSLFGKSIK